MARQGNDLILSEYPDGRPIILGHQERLEHTGIVGETGSGKSRFIEHMLRQDLRAWPKTHCGLLLVDPHGDVFDGISGRDILPKESDGIRALGFRDHVEAGETDQTWNRGVSSGAGVSDSAGSTETKTSGWNKASSRNAGTSLGKSHATSLSASHSDGIAETETYSVTDTVGGNESITTSESQTVGDSDNWSDAKSQSVNLAPVVFSVLGKEAEQPVFLSIDDQLTLAMQKIFRLRNREAYVLTSEMDIPVFFRSPEVLRSDVSRVIVEMAAGWYQRESGLTLPFDMAIKRVRDRDREWDGGGELALADADFAKPHGVIQLVARKRAKH
jgi:Helicase HerA, central domain